MLKNNSCTPLHQIPHCVLFRRAARETAQATFGKRLERLTDASELVEFLEVSPPVHWCALSGMPCLTGLGACLVIA